MHRRCGACKVVYFVDFGCVGLGNVVSHKFEVVVAYEVTYVVLVACKVVVEAYYIVAFVQKTFA
jgi:hypothetical protein